MGEAMPNILTARGPCGRRFCRTGCGRSGCNRLRELETARAADRT